MWTTERWGGGCRRQGDGVEDVDDKEMGWRMWTTKRWGGGCGRQGDGRRENVAGDG